MIPNCVLGIEQFATEIELMTGKRPGIIWKTTFLVLAPVSCLFHYSIMRSRKPKTARSSLNFRINSLRSSFVLASSVKSSSLQKLLMFLLPIYCNYSENVYKMLISKLFSSYGKEYTQEIRQKIMGTSLNDSARVFNGWHYWLAQTEIGIPLNGDEIRQYLGELGSVHFRHIPGVERLIRHLHKHGIPMGYATSSGLEEHQMKTESHRELFSLFSHGLCVPNDSEVLRGKPYPDCYQVCANRFRNPPSDCLVFEDSINGAWAGIRAGMQVVWIPDQVVQDNQLDMQVKLRIDSFENFKPEKVGLPPYLG
ncbi:probable pseudouridine-5'-phosphatase [Octopus sinensis]|uniref:Probable pseudouridine-5'-phosphatase n=1 Tax=Octopus sinensis TaxID=2607531 RepID=A0A6P7TVH2_9MOLL|nr:probable pseudouridine-5'-phosphatase [Octopus sinensis]